MMDLASLGQQAIKICEMAGLEIKKIYTDVTMVAATLKADHSPVTSADLAAHDIMQQQIDKLSVKFPLLSEEGTLSSADERAHWQTYWLADPLDGTKEFIARTGDFSVNLALIDHGIPVVGVIHLPLAQKTFFAYQRGGAWQIAHSGHAVRLHTRQAVKPLTIIASRHSDFTRLPLPLQKFCLDPLLAHPLRRLGSAAKFGLVAAGEVDIYFRLSPTMQWDTAAGDCIVREAGGITCQLNGAPLSYSSLEPFENPHFVSLSDPNFLPELLALLT